MDIIVSYAPGKGAKVCKFTGWLEIRGAEWWTRMFNRFVGVPILNSTPVLRSELVWIVLRCFGTDRRYTIALRK